MTSNTDSSLNLSHFSDDIESAGTSADSSLSFEDFAKWEAAVQIIDSQWESSLESEASLNDLMTDMDFGVGMTFQSPNQKNPVTGLIDFVLDVKCAKCGKKMKYPIPGGYCSLECFTSDIIEKILSGNHPFKRIQEKLVEDISKIMEVINLLMNLVSSIPYYITLINSLPNIYANYVLMKINIAFIVIRKILNKVLIKMNDIIILILEDFRDCAIEIDNALFPAVNVIVQTTNALILAMNNLYGVAYNLLTAVNSFFAIPGEGLAFNFTPRSISYNPSGFAVQIPLACNLSASALNFVNVDAIMELIKLTFPPIQAVEFFLEPEEFELRLILSDQNYKAILAAIEPLLRILTFGAEALPKYEKLSFTNINFLLYLLTSWGPTTKMTFGFPMPCP